MISVWYCLKYWSHDRFPCLIYYKASVFVRCIYVATRDQVAAHQCGSMRSLPLLIWNLCLDGGSWWITMLDSSSIYVPLLLLLHPLPKITATVSFYKKFCFAPVRNHSSLLCPSLSCRMHNPLYQSFAIPLYTTALKASIRPPYIIVAMYYCLASFEKNFCAFLDHV